MIIIDVICESMIESFNVLIPVNVPVKLPIFSLKKCQYGQITLMALTKYEIS